MEKVAKKIRKFIGDYFEKHNLKYAVFGKSKGVDSSVAAALLAGISDIQPIGVIMPCYSEADDEQIAKEVLDFYKIPCVKVDLNKAYDSLVDIFYNIADIGKQLLKFNLDDNLAKSFEQRKKYALGNIKLRLRMITLYHVAQITQGAVIGTANFSEYMTGFWTLHGDVGDINPIGNLYKSTEVYALAKYLKVPEKSLKAVPSDGMQITPKGTDEDQLGLPYEELDKVIGQFLKNKSLAQIQQATGLSEDKVKTAVKRIKSTEFKRNLPVKISRKELGL